MALSQRTQKQLLEAAAPMRVVPAPLRPVPSAPLNDTLGEEFLFAGGSLTAPSSRAVKIRPRAPVLGVIAVGLAIVLVLVVRSLTASKPEPTRVPVKLAPTAAQPAPAPAVIPMSIVTSSLRPSAARSYSASVTVRNPT